MNKDEMNEINKILESIDVEPITEESSLSLPKKSSLRAYAVAASIALAGVLGYGVGHYTSEPTTSKQSVVQTSQPEVAKPLPIPAYNVQRSLDKLVSFEGNAVADALEKTLQYGNALTMPELIKERCAADKNSVAWSWYDTHTEENVGVDRKGLCVPKGEGVVVIVHGGGLLTPARIRQGYSEGLFDYAVRYTEKEFSDLLEGRLPTGERISMYKVEELDGVMERRYGVVVPLSVVKETKNGYQTKEEFVTNPLVIARAGGTKYLENYFDKTPDNVKVGNWHNFAGRDASIPEGRLVFLYYHCIGLNVTDDLGNIGRFLGVERPK